METRRQAALRRDVPARVALSRTRSRRSGAGAGRRLVRRQRAPGQARRPDGGGMSAKRTLALRPDPGGVVPKTAMVMAAGLGKRNRPLTATRPNPLAAVPGQPLLDHSLTRLRSPCSHLLVVHVLSFSHPP